MKKDFKVVQVKGRDTWLKAAAPPHGDNPGPAGERSWDKGNQEMSNPLAHNLSCGTHPERALCPRTSQPMVY